jgi:hypothetical protein
MAGVGMCTGERLTTSCGHVVSCITCFYATTDWSFFGPLNGFDDCMQCFCGITRFTNVAGMLLGLRGSGFGS